MYRRSITNSPFATFRLLVSLLPLVLISTSLAIGQHNWPEHRGPNGDYHLKTEADYPTMWSVAADENIVWRVPLPETGHSGIAIWENRLFLTCFRELTAKDNRRQGTWVSESRGYCLDAETGAILWSCDLPGRRPNQVNGTFTDSTTPTPVTDGQHVWFVNAGGFMACHTMDGTRIWERAFEVRTKHSAKQFQPFLHNSRLYYAMLRKPGDPQRRPQTAKDWDKNSKEGWPWMFVCSVDSLTGRPNGIIPGGISVHSKGALGILNGGRVLLQARGGGHFPPEKPYGVSLSSLDAGHKLIWERPDLYFEGTHYVDAEHAFCFDKRNDFFVLDLATGETEKRVRMRDVGMARLFDLETGQYEAPVEVSTLPWKRLLTHRSNIGVGAYHFFMGGAPGTLGRIDWKLGEVCYLQVPIQVVHSTSPPIGLTDNPTKASSLEKTFSWTEFESGDKTGSGFEVEGDRRRLSHGFGHISAATPIVVNDHIYFTTALGTVYVVDATAKEFDEHALVAVNDLGAPGKTWTLSPFAAAHGRLYQRTSRDIICIGSP